MIRVAEKSKARLKGTQRKERGYTGKLIFAGREQVRLYTCWNPVQHKFGPPEYFEAKRNIRDNRATMSTGNVLRRKCCTEAPKD